MLMLPPDRCRNPAAWDAYCKFIEDTSSDWERERTNLLGAYHARLTSGDSALQNAAASAFVACTPTPTLRTAAYTHGCSPLRRKSKAQRPKRSC